jgi:energy-coupling factor transporter transmembrane protein EcfT
MNTTLMLTLTTTPIMVADATENLMAPLKKIRFPVHEMAMMMSIALRFVPTLAGRNRQNHEGTVLPGRRL